MVVSNDSFSHVVWYQSPNHPELSTGAGDARAIRYNIAGFWPTTFFDGFYRAPQVTETDSFYGVYRNMADQARSISSILQMSLDTATTKLDSTRLYVGVHITPTDSAVDRVSTLMLSAVVYEDSAPFYSQIGGDTLYARFCGRCVIGDTWGVPLTLHFGTDYDTVLSTPLDTTWIRSRLGVVVLVQDTSSLRVMQSVARGRF